MAIQFHCPYCTTPIRVPDSAGGKRGTCPRCRAKILVPSVAVKAAAGQPEQQPAAEPEPKRKKPKSIRERLLEGPQFAGLPETEPAPAVSDAVVPAEVVSESAATGPIPIPIPPRPVTAAIPAVSCEAATPYARALKRRRRRRRFVWVPVLFGLLLVGGVAAFLVLTGRKKLEGTLNAVIVPDAGLPPRTIGVSLVPVDEQKVSQVLNHLQKKPLGVLRSDIGLMKHEVTATASGLSVSVYDTDRVQFYRVDAGRDKTLRDFLNDKAAQLDRPRVKELDAGLKEFFERSADALSAGGGIPKDALEVLRSRVIVNSLVGAAGYHLLASVDGQLYLCMYEDDRGRLYYLLPRGTKKFSIVGRKLSDGTRQFPGRYVVDVEGTLERTPVKASEEAEPPKKKAEPKPADEPAEQTTSS
jgi:hypothetical protein